jgi:hypothetical protein
MSISMEALSELRLQAAYSDIGHDGSWDQNIAQYGEVAGRVSTLVTFRILRLQTPAFLR